ncbi:hypothetical protein DRO50_01815 [Candidatus Bathyarchaeota archaeon]|nr:MAG: hypothetical protein DRO50_01815 [Candidatus Bathyarchaeota archaeon]
MHFSSEEVTPTFLLENQNYSRFLLLFFFVVRCEGCETEFLEIFLLFFFPSFFGLFLLVLFTVTTIT